MSVQGTEVRCNIISHLDECGEFVAGDVRRPERTNLKIHRCHGILNGKRRQRAGMKHLLIPCVLRKNLPDCETEIFSGKREALYAVKREVSIWF